MKYTISNKGLNIIIDQANKAGIEYESFEGTLNDNYIFYNTEKMKIAGLKQFKYWIVQESYENEWNSELFLIPTNDEEQVEQYKKAFFKFVYS